MNPGGSDGDSAIPVLSDPMALPAAVQRPVVAIGNFDGVHLGHRAVIDRARAMAARLQAPVAAVTFEPHPRRHFAPGKPLFELSPGNLKAQLLATTGIDAVVALTFDRQLAATSADDFAQGLLASRLGVRGVVVGYDFHYGSGRQGTTATLAEEGRRFGFEVDIVAAFGPDEPVSSSRIRACLAEGDVVRAGLLLGGRWCVAGNILHGDKRGRLLGYPTANMLLAPGSALAFGIYAVRIKTDGKIHDGVASYGSRPTFDDGAPRLETHVFDFAGDLYGRRAIVEFVDRIRGESRFESAEALVARMDEDSRIARRMLAGDSGNSFLEALR